MVPALACIKWFDCHHPGAVVSQSTSRPNAENCSGFPPPTRQSASIEAELLGLTSIYSETVSISSIMDMLVPPNQPKTAEILAQNASKMH